MDFCPPICLAIVLSFFAAVLEAAPEISNHENGSVVRYPVVLLKGTVPESAKPFIRVTNQSSDREDTRSNEGVVSKGKFKILAELVPGENRLKLSDSKGSSTLTLHYEPQTNPYYVRVIWMTDRDGGTDYATCVENDPQNYDDKLDAAARLLQTFTAERMYDTGYGRRTFRLELNDAGRVKVHTLAAPELASHYHQLDGGKWYGEISRWLNREHPDPYAKNIVVAAYTRKDPETGKMLAHTALGGGNLGLFGGASVFSWPDSIADVTDAFLDDTKVDASKVHDDSAGRHTFWGAASTTLGATLHEMGHTFGLPHCRDRFGIMTRGFDHLNRAFTLYDPPGGQRLNGYRFKDDEIGYFAPISASFLLWSLWFQLDPPATEDKARPTIKYDSRDQTFAIESEHPIRWIGYWQKDSVSKFREYRGDVAPKQLTIKKAEWEKELGASDISRISVMPENGWQARLVIPAPEPAP